MQKLGMPSTKALQKPAFVDRDICNDKTITVSQISESLEMEKLIKYQSKTSVEENLEP